ncbi:MAG: hypothetical protein LBO09_07865 [Candidatus Peribacteria bacterium]|nr:hypothetical protein [Candidatus Peribacteria bacterium]
MKTKGKFATLLLIAIFACGVFSSCSKKGEQKQSEREKKEDIQNIPDSLFTNVSSDTIIMINYWLGDSVTTTPMIKIREYANGQSLHFWNEVIWPMHGVNHIVVNLPEKFDENQIYRWIEYNADGHDPMYFCLELVSGIRITFWMDGFDHDATIPKVTKTIRSKYYQELFIKGERIKVPVLKAKS